MDVLGQALTEHDYITKWTAILTSGIYCFVLSTVRREEEARRNRRAGASELVNQAQGDDVVGRDTVVFVEAVVVIQQVDFVINVGRHITVEVIGSANVHIFDQIFIGVAAVIIEIFAFGLQLGDGRTQAEVELILRGDFEVLRFVGHAVIAVRGHIAGF